MEELVFDYQRMVVGYHGCDSSLLEKVLLKKETLRASENEFDWLGSGIYFWEYGPKRALEFALEQKGRNKVSEPTVLGAYIHLGRCFDLTDVSNTQALSEAHSSFVEMYHSFRIPLPKNQNVRGNSDLLLRHLDCAVINWYMSLLDQEAERGYAYQTIRGVFTEGEPIYEGSGIHRKTHVQIAVRDPACVLGYFLPSF